MRWLLRLIAIGLGCDLVSTCLLLLLLTPHVVHHGVVGPLQTTWIIVSLPVQAFASAQLWRLKQSGRYAALGLFAFSLILWLMGVATGQAGTLMGLLRLATISPIAVILMLPSARRVCARPG
jgi:hypothetical protein